MVHFHCAGRQAGRSYPLAMRLSFPTHLLASKHDALKHGFTLNGRATLFSTGSFLNGREMSSMLQSEATFTVLTLALLHPQDERKSMSPSALNLH